MRQLKRSYDEARRRLARGDSAGLRRAAVVIHKLTRRLTAAQKPPRGPMLLLENSAALLVKSPDPARLAALHRACASCHRREGIAP